MASGVFQGDAGIQGLDKVRLLMAKLKLKAKRRQKLKEAVRLATQEAQRKAKSLAPVLHGHLRDNIEMSVIPDGDSAWKGTIYVDMGVVPYARRQEWTHPRKSFFMWRGRLYGIRFLQNLVKDQDFMIDVVFPS